MKIKKTKIIKSIKSIRTTSTRVAADVDKRRTKNIPKLTTIDEQLYNAARDNNIDDVNKILLQGLANIEWRDKVNMYRKMRIQIKCRYE
jgi:hypothetical protein